MGHDRGLISARGDIIVRRAQNATLRCGGCLQVQIDAIDSNTNATGIDVQGVVRGGSTEAELCCGDPRRRSDGWGPAHRWCAAGVAGHRGSGPGFERNPESGPAQGNSQYGASA